MFHSSYEYPSLHVAPIPYRPHAIDCLPRRACVGGLQSRRGRLSPWRPLAEQGDVVAQFKLGVRYEKVRGVPQGDVHAQQWNEKVALRYMRERELNSNGSTSQALAKVRP